MLKIFSLFVRYYFHFKEVAFKVFGHIDTRNENESKQINKQSGTHVTMDNS